VQNVVARDGETICINKTDDISRFVSVY